MNTNPLHESPHMTDSQRRSRIDAIDGHLHRIETSLGVIDEFKDCLVNIHTTLKTVVTSKRGPCAAEATGDLLDCDCDYVTLCMKVAILEMRDAHASHARNLVTKHEKAGCRVDR